MSVIHVFTHDGQTMESHDLALLNDAVARLNLQGQYSTREGVEPENAIEDITVTTFQAKAALALSGLYDEVDAYMQLDTTDRLTKLKWEYSSFNRSDASVLSIGEALGLTERDLDNLFSLAQTIT